MASKHPSIVKALEQLALSKPDKPAFIFVNESMDRRVLSRQQVWDYCRKYAAVLKMKGLGKGDVVCNTLNNCPERVITELGSITSGAISHSGQMSRADGADLVAAMNKTKAKAIIVDPDNTNGIITILKPKLESFDKESGEVTCPEIPELKYILACPLKKDRTKKTLLDYLDDEEEMVHEDLDSNEICQYLCTSGSTSMYKVLAFNSECLTEFGKQFGLAMDLGKCDIFMNSRPLGWMGGYPVVYLAHGATRVVRDESGSNPDNIWELEWKIICQERVETAFTIPHSLTEYSLMRCKRHENEEMKTPKLKNIMTGGGPASEKQVQAALENLADRVTVLYGCTEAGCISSYWFKDLEDFEEFKVGWPAQGLKVKVVDNNDKEVPCGQRGIILMQTSSTALSYLDEPEKTLETFRPDGWINMGDIGMVNSSGQLYVMGRENLAIMKGPHVIYPEIIESVILECPKVKNVVVTGVPDEKYFETVCAVIIKHNEAQLSKGDIISFFDEKSAEVKDVLQSPDYVLFMEALPLNINGKVDRNAVKQEACRILNIKPKV